MPFVKGRKKQGGRKAGTGNKKKTDLSLVKQFISEYPDLNPLVELAKIALDTDNDATLRSNCLKEIAKYRIPTIKPTSQPIILEQQLPKEPSEKIYAIVDLATNGELALDEAQALSKIIADQHQSDELENISRQLTALEASR